MADKFQNKYRIPSARLPHWDYGWNAAYFITICTKDRECFFGEIVNAPSNVTIPSIVETQCIASLPPSQLPPSPMQLSEIGKIVQTEWLKTPEIRPDMNLELGAYIVMPNHFHGIIIIGENQFNTRRDAMHGVSKTTTNDDDRRDAMHCVSTEYNNTFAPQSKNLASIIRGFKSSVTTNARKLHAGFAWQSRFHDHIIRDNQSFHNISEYIVNNPWNWSADQFFK